MVIHSFGELSSFFFQLLTDHEKYSFLGYISVAAGFSLLFSFVSVKDTYAQT